MRKFIFFTLIILFSISVFFQICFPLDKKNIQEKIFLIEQGQSSKEIALNLEKKKLIRWGPLFRLYALLAGVSKKLQAGSYQLSPSMNIPKMAEKFVSGDVIKIFLTIPEGFNLEQIQERLSQNFNIAKADLIGLMKVENYKKDFQFLEDAPDSATLEGYLFPDTYQFSYGMRPEEIIKKILENFDKKLTPDLKAEIKQQKKTIFKIMTMASMTEKEVKTKEDKELGSGILWKRLNRGMALQVDATISYITGKQTIKTSKTDTQIDSRYNTYKYRGLPQGPISNPGLESIEAAIYPKNSDFWYYLSTPDGITIFSKTLEEHNIAKEKYLK